MKYRNLCILCVFLLTACTSSSPTLVIPSTEIADAVFVTSRLLPTTLSISLGKGIVENGLSLDIGGDADSKPVSVGNPPVWARQTGNGHALPSQDGNLILDYYLQFNIDDSLVFAGRPTYSVRIEVEYFDQGTDTFRIQYDSRGEGGPFGDGTFQETHPIIKTNSLRFKTAVFSLRDVYFKNRDNGADFRISDENDGAEIVRQVNVVLLPSPTIINVDDCGADPWDTNPDSQAIQDCIDSAEDGDIITFTSGVDSPDYQGYLIDRTIFLVATTAKSDLTFTSTDPENHAFLGATADLKGFVMRLYARSQVSNSGEIDNITVSHLNLDGGRDERICFGEDRSPDGSGDNWGSWLPECSNLGDPWCSPGTLAMTGRIDWQDPTQNYDGNPSQWSTGQVVDDLVITNTECGTALGFNGAAGLITNTTIDTAGDHVHASGCDLIDADEPIGGWADGITLNGPGHLVIGNTIIDASDIAITHFGGVETVIAGNTVLATQGNHGMFSGIMIGPNGYGEISNGQITGNKVINRGDESCGGIHAGIVLGPHMWGGGCRYHITGAGMIGTSNQCTNEPAQPYGSYCTSGEECQIWAYVAADTTYTLSNNRVSGAYVNYLVEGLDLVGTLDVFGNTSLTPRWTDWEGAKNRRTRACSFSTWGPTDRVAHHPSLPGWVNKRIHCER